MDENEKEIEKIVERRLEVPKDIFKKKEHEVNPSEKDISHAELLVQEMSKQGIITIASNDPEVQEKILNQAKLSIAMELSKIDSRGKKEVQEAAYDANKEACKYYGVADSVETWKIKMMKGGSAFWFVVWFLISSVTFTPITIVADKINNFIKWYWLSLTITIIIFAFVVIGLPLLFKFKII
jgi:hypothetical protein